eukprot:TRINITY_DN462_c2_g1_i3.p1 TRINITY_DN462_c2_g1~~TRINITY_DN462_c2_g1_i3.p1  ORF type:complete len:215 (+),score=52.53 TRINITY_DN462_c2_g1_i3:102-746(+)
MSDAMAEIQQTEAPAAVQPAEGDVPMAVDGEAGEDLDLEIEEMKLKVLEMEEQLKGQQTELAEGGGGEEEFAGDDNASVYVGQVDYAATPQELYSHFAECGTVKRVTILCDKWTNHPKGFAYLEFEDPASVEKAVTLHDTTFCGRKIKVHPKRTNIPGHNKGAKGGKKGAKGGFKGNWWDPYGSTFSPYASGKGKKGKKSWMSGKGGKKGFKGW